MRSIEQLMNFALSQGLLKFSVLVFHGGILIHPTDGFLGGSCLVAIEETAVLIMRRQLRGILSELIDSLDIGLLICYLSFVRMLWFTCLRLVYVGGSIIFLNWFVSLTLFMFPCSSGSMGSSGENLHSPSTMNLY